MNEKVKTVLRKTPILRKIMKRIDDLRSEIDGLNNQIDDLKNEVNDHKNINNQLSNENNQLRNKNSHLENENNNLRTENTDLKTDNGNLIIENGDLRNENNNFGNKVNELKNKLTGLLSLKDNTEHDDQYIAEDVPIPKIVSHDKWQEYLYEVGNKKGKRILEIGSREVTGKSIARKKFSNAEYIGFDIYPGENVDVVGDAHYLSAYFKEQEKFDIIFSSASFEHFAMPWLVAEEISKLLKIGGIVFVETHFSYSSHERPWHFFQFSDLALKVLFSKVLGFECIEAGMSNPMIGRFSSLADEYLKNKPISGLYCHSEFLGKKIKEVESFDWETVDLKNVLGETKYPELAI